MVLPASALRQRGFIINPYAFGGPAASWRTAFDRGAGVSNDSGWNGYTIREDMSTALLGGSATKMKFTLQAASGSSALVSAAYVQIAAASGDPYDFDTTPVQILFGGSGSVTVPASSTVTSDEVALSIDGTRPLVMSVYFGSPATIRAYSGTSGFTSRYKFGNDATTVDTSGYFTTTGGLLRSLELFG